MIDVTDCYLVVFHDDAGTVHSIPFAKDDEGDRKSVAIAAALHEAGFKVERYSRYVRRL
jgi:hypothetical protein